MCDNMTRYYVCSQNHYTKKRSYSHCFFAACSSVFLEAIVSQPLPVELSTARLLYRVLHALVGDAGGFRIHVAAEAEDRH